MKATLHLTEQELERAVREALERQGHRVSAVRIAAHHRAGHPVGQLEVRMSRHPIGEAGAAAAAEAK